MLLGTTVANSICLFLEINGIFFFNLVINQQFSCKIFARVKPSTYLLVLYFFHLHTMIQMHFRKFSGFHKQIFTDVSQELNISKLTKIDWRFPNSMGTA